MRRLLAALDRHWFAPASLRDLALLRIVVVSAQLFAFRPEWSQQSLLLQADGQLYRPLTLLKVLLSPLGEWGARPDPMFLRATYLALLVSGALAIVGRYTRPALLVFAATNTILQTHAYSYGELHHPEALMMIALWILAVSPAGEAWSLDDLERRMVGATRAMQFKRANDDSYVSPYARWPLQLLQWLFALVYLSAGLEKVATGGLDWYNGYTLGYYLLQDGVRHHVPASLWLAAHPGLLHLASLGAAAFELTFVVAVVVPRVAWIYVFGGVAFHTSIYLLQRAPFFQYYAIYFCFVESIRRYAPTPAWLRPKPVAPWTVLYDGQCPLCIRTVTLLDYVDLRHCLAFADLESDGARQIASTVSLAELRSRLHVVAPDGRTYSGFYAFRQLTRLLPPLWVLLPVTYFPRSDTVGTAVYDGVARRRPHVACGPATCSPV
jgi:predicted DCC family thiol-disulfide oxidoreductase YuxK/uncharacterized membrane protein YphA (DoxX/SURF4 family)